MCSGRRNCATRSCSPSSFWSCTGLGVQIPAPGVSLDRNRELSACQLDESEGGIFGYLTLFTGGGVVLSLFGLGILPYITASIVIQILTVAVPKLEEWQSPGSSRPAQDHAVDPLSHGHPVALIQSAGFVFLINRSPEQIYGFDPRPVPRWTTASG